MALGQWEPAAAAAVVGLAGFQLWQAWNNNAPSLSECRGAHPNDLAVRQRLLDADLTVGTMAVIIGVGMTVLTKDGTALVLMLAVFGMLSLWAHQIMDADAR